MVFKRSERLAPDKYKIKQIISPPPWFNLVRVSKKLLIIYEVATLQYTEKFSKFHTVFTVIMMTYFGFRQVPASYWIIICQH